MISPGLLNFLSTLETNNNRDWFENNKKEFIAHRTVFKKFNESLFEAFQKHDKLESMKVFRIYRDVRFSADKTPYKTHFAASFKRIKPQLRGGYYLQIKPGASFIATGFWNPEKEDLLRIRKEFEIDASGFKAVVDKKSFKDVWGELEGEEVKMAPKGFSKEHENIGLIRKKQFVFTKSFSDETILKNDFITEVDNSFKAIRPFFDYMTEILTTDLNGVSLIE